MPELIEVELPVCERCLQAGKIPRHSAEGKVTEFYCTGRDGHRHKKTKMVYRPFREVMVDESSREE